MDNRISRRSFLKLLGAGATLLLFSGLALGRILPFVSGARSRSKSRTKSTVGRSTVSNTTTNNNTATNTTFKVGADVGTFGGKYGWDMGHNQLSADILWEPTQPLTRDLSKLDPNPAIPYVTQNPQAIEQVFQPLQGLDLVKIYLFEENEGLVFDGNNNNRLVGIDGELVNNVKKVLDTAHKYNIQVYFILIDCWLVNDLEYNADSLPPDRKAAYRGWKGTQRTILKSIITDPEYFTNVVLTPLLEQIKDHPALFGFDLLNEPEAMIKDDPTHLISDNDVINFITGCTAGITKIAPRLKTSVGCDDTNVARRYAAATPISFADYHAYIKPGENLEDYKALEYAGKDLLLGECGIYHDDDTKPPTPEIVANELAVTEKIVSQAQAKGYSGALVYGLFSSVFMAPEHKPILLAWLKQFKNSLSSLT